MKAKIGKELKNARFEVGKEQINRWQVMVIHKGKIERAVNAYCWMGRSTKASVVYAAIWVYGPKKSTSGRGSAGGGGYDKESAAMQSAITSAGITLWGSIYADEKGNVPGWNTQSRGREPEPENLKEDCRIDGVGDRAIRVALTAIARAAGYRGHLVIV